MLGLQPILLPGLDRGGVAAGWILASTLAAPGYFWLARAIGQDTTRFLLYGLGSQVARFLLLLVFFTLSTWLKKTSTLGFVTGGLVGYIAHLFAEIVWLNKGLMVDKSAES